ncbi:MAG: hypothetical protein J7513_01835 [Solirubrobacteraceae bacterium]|nr:hypothetical protein [Solirubrobacteraceae bacterium]
MGAFGVVVVVVLVASIVVGLVLLRRPSPWDEIGRDGLDADRGPDRGGTQMPSRAADEAALRELIAEKRAARLARDGAGGPSRPLAQGPPWAHMDSELVDEARALVARRRDRLARQGKPDVDEHAELERILGPPHV